MKSHNALLAFIAVVQGSQHLFSVHDDLLAFPQYDVVFSDTFLSDADAESRIAYAASSSAPPRQRTDTASHDPGGPAVDSSKGELLRSPGTPADAHSPETGREGSSGGHSDARRKPNAGEHQAGTYELMHLNGQRYLCAIPVVETVPKNDTAEAVARAEEEKELARATTRGWELLQGMQGQCMYFISGWWSYQFCYNGEIKQFHPLPPQKGMPIYPPVEDPTTPSYILGRVTAQHEQRGRQQQQHQQDGRGVRGEITDGNEKSRSVYESTELQAKGEMRYLVQKLGAGTICDLTGKERRIEVQYHCHPQSSDRIGWIKEITTCSYLMVVYTPRLCNDVAFLPPRNNKAHAISCQEVLRPDEIEAWKAKKASEAEQHLLRPGGAVVAPQDGGRVKGKALPNQRQRPKQANAVPPLRIGGVEIGANKHVGSPGRRIDNVGTTTTTTTTTPTTTTTAGKDHSPQTRVPNKQKQHHADDDDTNNNGAKRDADASNVVATRDSVSQGGKLHLLSEEELRRLGLDADTVEAVQRELQDLAGDKAWTLEIVELRDGVRQMRGVVVGGAGAGAGGEGVVLGEGGSKKKKRKGKGMRKGESGGGRVREEEKREEERGAGRADVDGASDADGEGREGDDGSEETYVEVMVMEEL